MTTNLHLGTPIVLALKQRIVANIAAYVAQVNLYQTANGLANIDIPDPSAIFDFAPPIAYMTAFPTIGIQDGDVAITDDTGWSATTHSQFSVIAFEQDSDQEALSWKLRAWQRAIAGCVLEGRRLPPEGWGVQLVRVSPGPTLGREESPRTFRSFVAVTINVRSEEDGDVP